MVEKGREKGENIPRVEKDSTKRPKPRAEWALLGWTIAFSMLSGVVRESAILFVTCKGKQKRRMRSTERVPLIPNDYLRFAHASPENAPSATTIIRKE